jgi:signal transduction histidine kinase
VLTVEKLRRTLFLSNPTAVNLIELAQTVIQQVKAAYKEKQQTIQLEASGAFENIVLDSRLTRSILTNLLTNATKYSPQRSTIICKLDAQPEQIILQITDQGIGIPEVDQKQLFEPFYRAQNATEIKGTGLGLVIVKQSVEAQQGKINIKTAENQGTTFTITLPRRL